MLDYAHVNALRGWRESGEGAERILGTNSRHCGSIRALKLIRIRLYQTSGTNIFIYRVYKGVREIDESQVVLGGGIGWYMSPQGKLDRMKRYPRRGQEQTQIRFRFVFVLPREGSAVAAKSQTAKRTASL
jgi:hypothetical protein